MSGATAAPEAARRRPAPAPRTRRPPATCCARRCSGRCATSSNGGPGRRSRCPTSPSAAGVSRQTLYKEFGSRDEFAQAFVIHVGERFLDEVDAAVREHLDDPRAAIGAALETFLRTAGEDPVVRVLLRDDGTGGMLPFVTTQGMPVVVFATARLFDTISEGWPEAPPEKAQLLAESLVRLAISYITAPGDDARRDRRRRPASCSAPSSTRPSASPS